MEGTLCSITGTDCQTTASARLYFYQEADLFSQGSSELQVENAVVGTYHTYSVQEVWTNHLYATYVTDATTWPEQALPYDDNPGWGATYQGEVYYDWDQMGTATFTGTEYHAGSWYSWTGKVYAAEYPPYYCNVAVPANGPFSYDNYGPVDGC